MSGVEHANLVICILTFCLLFPVAIYIRKAKQTANLYVRRIAGIDAIDETLGQSVEAGRPVIFTTGLSSINPILYACLGVLYYVAKRSATYKNKLYVPQYDPEVLAVAEDTVSTAYAEAKRSSYFNPDNLPYWSSEQFAYAAGYVGLVHRENIGGAFLFGEFAAESLILAEAGQQIGAKQVGATISPEQVPFFIVACDYTLIGEELFGAAAYLTRDPIQLGSLYAQDRAKLIVLLIIVIGVILATINSLSPGLIAYDFYNFWR